VIDTKNEVAHLLLARKDSRKNGLKTGGNSDGLRSRGNGETE
jgi:hypothetical protein